MFYAYVGSLSGGKLNINKYEDVHYECAKLGLNPVDIRSEE
jgi:hypothetical protein